MTEADKPATDDHRATIVPAGEMTELYVRLGRLQRENESFAAVIRDLSEAISNLRSSLRLRDLEMTTLRAALANYTDVVESVNDPNDWTPKVRDAGGPAREAIGIIDRVQAHRADCPGCVLCINYTPSPFSYRDDMDTAPDGRKLR